MRSYPVQFYLYICIIIRSYSIFINGLSSSPNLIYLYALLFGSILSSRMCPYPVIFCLRICVIFRSDPIHLCLNPLFSIPSIHPNLPFSDYPILPYPPFSSIPPNAILSRSGVLQIASTWGDYTGKVIEYDYSYVSMITITNTFNIKSNKL